MEDPVLLPSDATVAVAPAPDFGLLFQAIPTPCLVISPALTILAANAAYLRLVGRAASDLLGLHIVDALPANPADPLADGSARLRASLERVLAGACADTMDVQRYDVALEAGGSVFLPRYWKPVNTPLLHADGTVRYIIHSVEEASGANLTGKSSLRDVLALLNETLRDLKAVDEIAYAAAAILGEALGASRVGYGTIDHASDSLQVERDWCAPGAGTLAGVSDLRSDGSFIDDLKRGIFVAIENVDLDPRTAAAAVALRARSATAFVNVPLIEDGVLVAVLYINDAHPRQWTTQELVLVKEVAARIRTASERLRGVAALRESEARFRTIADAMPQMVWSTLPDGYHDYFNEQWYSYTGVPRQSTDGEGWNDIFHPDDQARSRAVWQACLETGDTYEIEYRLRHHSGAYRWVLGRALPIRARDGSIVRWMGTCTDIDAQKRAEDELRQASQRKDEFLAMLAHELRNPLAPISSAAHLLILGKADPQRVQKSGEIILRQVGHLTHLVDDLLDVSRVTSGLVQIERVVIDLQAVLHSAVEQARPGIEARRHHLTVALPPAPMCVQGDKTRLVQTIVNLLNNAAKYTAPGGAIALSLEMADGMACITVADNGIGIGAELLPHVFDLFIQAERTPDRIQGGLGVGLALVQRIVELHQGSVQAISEGLGKGSRFTVRLPLVEAAGSADRGRAGGPGDALAGAGEAATVPRTRLPTVMIVDDNPDGAQSLAALIGARGYRVRVVGDGAAALQIADGEPVDVYILDIGLPGMDGYALARRLRATPGGRAATLVALTGYGKKEDRLLALASGFDHHLVKPVDIAALEKILLRR
ncbi:PAS domain S-box protein [Massilia atriviolacea]|nr:ATP-binding protein [Massilia atriviolacea]